MRLTISLTPVYLGIAMSQSPGYLKLRKIKAATNIGKTVSTLSGHASTVVLFGKYG